MSFFTENQHQGSGNYN